MGVSSERNGISSATVACVIALEALALTDRHHTWASRVSGTYGNKDQGESGGFGEGAESAGGMMGNNKKGPRSPGDCMVPFPQARSQEASLDGKEISSGLSTGRLGVG